MTTTSRFNSRNMHQAFKPYFGQLSDEEHASQLAKKGPQRVAFTWAVRHEVTNRATSDDVDAGDANYEGQALAFDKSRTLGAPRMEFQSGSHYARWRESMNVGIEERYSDIDFVDNEDVPGWMLDLAEDKERRQR